MEELFLRSFFVTEELNIINQQQVNISVLLTKLFLLFVLMELMKSLAKFSLVTYLMLAAGLFFQDQIPDRLHQIRFSQANAAVNKQRVVSRTGASATAKAAA